MKGLVMLPESIKPVISTSSAMADAAEAAATTVSDESPIVDAVLKQIMSRSKLVMPGSGDITVTDEKGLEKILAGGVRVAAEMHFSHNIEITNQAVSMPLDTYMELKGYKKGAAALEKQVADLERELGLTKGWELVRDEMVAEHHAKLLLKDEMIAGLRKQVAAFDAQAKKDRAEHKKLSDQFAAAQSRVSTLEAEMSALRSELGKKSVDIASAVKVARDELNARIRELQSQLDKAQADIRAKESARAALQKRMDTDTTSHASELSSLRSELSTLRTSKQSLMEAHGKEHAVLRSEITDLTERLAKQASEHETAKAELMENHATEVEALRGEIDRLNAVGAEGGGNAAVLAALQQQHAETVALLQQVSQQNQVLQSQLMNLLAMLQSSYSMAPSYSMVPAGGAYMVPVTAMPAPVAYGSMVPPHQFSASAPSYTAEAVPAATTPVAHGAHVLHSPGAGRGKAKRHHGPTAPASGAEPSRL
jgi:hypothetical protein